MAKNDTPAAKAGKKPAGAGSPSKGENDSSVSSGASTDGLEVFSTRDGFRRAGLSWSKKPTVVPLSSLSDEQVAMLKADPALKVREVDMPDVEEKETQDE